MFDRGTVIGVILLALLAVVFFVSSSLQGIFFDIVAEAEVLSIAHEKGAVALFIFFAAFSAMISPFSSVPLVPVAVTLWGWELTATLLLVGWLVGDSVAYAIGRFAGHAVLCRIINAEKLREYETYFSAHATFFTTLLVRLAMPAEIGYAFGIIRYRFWKYILVTAIAEIPFAVITIRASDALISFQPYEFLGWLAALCIIVGVCSYIFRRRRHGIIES